MHPFQQVRIGGRIRPTVGRDAVYPPMNSPDAIDGALGVDRRTECRLGQKGAGALQSTPRVVAIVGVLGDTGHGQGMQRLQQQGPQPADEHRGVSMHPADRAVFGKPPRPRCVVDAYASVGPSGPATISNRLLPRRVPYRLQRALRRHRFHGTQRLK